MSRAERKARRQEDREAKQRQKEEEQRLREEEKARELAERAAGKEREAAERAERKAARAGGRRRARKSERAESERRQNEPERLDHDVVARIRQYGVTASPAEPDELRDAEPPPPPPLTTDPNEPRDAELVLLATFLLAGCGSGGGSARADAATPKRVSGQPATIGVANNRSLGKI